MPKKKANGEGSIIYETARKKYRAAITDTEGKRVVKRFNKKEEAVQWITEINYEMHKKIYIPKSDITVEEWLIEWIDTFIRPNVKIATYVDYITTAEHIDPISGIYLHDLSAVTVQRFLNNMPPNTSTDRKKRIFRLLKAALKKAVDISLLSRNCLDSLSAPKKETKQIEIFTPDEVNLIFNYMCDIKTNYYVRKFFPFIALAFTTGARVGEIMALHWNDIDIAKKELHIRSTLKSLNKIGTVETSAKTESGKRKVIIPDAVMQLLSQKKSNRKIIDFNENDYVFCTKFGGPLDTSNVARMWRSILKGANIKYRNFHSIRHTHATELLSNGMPILEVARRIGHKKASTTLNMYGHVMKNFDEKLAEKIADIYMIK